jgi:glycosyltransferase involved in cell wall biosynthesis
VFFGVLKKSQGLDLIFNIDKHIIKSFPDIELHIIGGGPDESYFQSRAAKSVIPTIFHGFIPNDSDVDMVLSDCHIGMATYIPDPNNVSYFTDPSKIKRYLSVGLPVITTDVFEFSKNIKNFKAGILINYHNPQSFIEGLTEIINNYPLYCQNSFKLAKNYQYDISYGKLFK